MNQRHRGLRVKAAVVGLAVAVALPLAIVARADREPSASDAEVAEIRQFEADLRAGRLDADPQTKASIEYKLEAAKRDIEERDRARKSPAPKIPPTPGPSPTPRAPQPDLIYDVLQPPLSGSIGRITNAWAGDEPDGSRTTVMAGVLSLWDGTARPGPWGMVIINNTAHDAAALGPAALVRTPTAEGSVRIIAATGRRLLLEAENGVRFTFDVDTRTFVTPGAAPSP